MTRQLTTGEAALSLLLRHLPIKHGQHRILDRLCPKPWVNGDPVVSLAFYGRKLTLDISDLVGWHFAMLRDFDPEVAEVIVKFSDNRSEDIFWDIGANKGTLSYQIARKLPRAKIVAIEPQPILARQIVKNTDAPERWQIFEVGLGDEPRTMALYIPNGATGSASLVFRDGDSHIEVKIETAETIRVRSGWGWPTLIKIDVEGYEPNVIRSLHPAFKSQIVKCCVFECHSDKAQNFKEVCAAVEPFGYKANAIRKSVFATWLEETDELVSGVTDYALVKRSQEGYNGKIDLPN